ncbi:hypothetical protein Tco_1549617 [Tanacetum coccineum]
MEITVVTLVEEQMSSWKGNLPKLPIIIKYSAIGTKKYRNIGSGRDLLILPWPDLELHLSGDEFLRCIGGLLVMWLVRPWWCIRMLSEDLDIKNENKGASGCVLVFRLRYAVSSLMDAAYRIAQVDQGSQIKMIQVKEMMQDNDLKNSKSKDKGSKSRSQSMDEQSHYKQDKTITRQSINVKRHTFNVIGGTEEFEERDLNIGGDC